MATRGQIPTATIIKLARGNPGRRPLPKNEPTPIGAIRKPKGMRGLPSDLWDEFIANMHWLSWVDGPKARLWCYLEADVRLKPEGTTPAAVAQLRALGSELGFDPGSRARLGMAAGLRKTDAEQNKETVAAKFFDRHGRSD
jgi:hypothetical protein